VTARRRRRSRELDFVEAEDMFGRRYRVPRRVLVGEPPPDANVIDLRGTAGPQFMNQLGGQIRVGGDEAAARLMSAIGAAVTLGRDVAADHHQAVRKAASSRGGRMSAGKPRLPTTDLVRRVIEKLPVHSRTVDAVLEALRDEQVWESLCRPTDDAPELPISAIDVDAGTVTFHLRECPWTSQLIASGRVTDTGSVNVTRDSIRKLIRRAPDK
jgi:hypothetical protein